MIMASRPLLGGRLQLRAMNSIEAATVGRCGYPLLLQSGETCHGEPNHDRQHPHDFFMELAALYEHAISPSLAWSLYVAPSGEPANGPVALQGPVPEPEPESKTINPVPEPVRDLEEGDGPSKEQGHH